MIHRNWQDIDLSDLDFNLSAGEVRACISSNYNGAELARIACSGLMHISTDTSMCVNNSNFPVFVGCLKIMVYDDDAIGDALRLFGYGFKFDGNVGVPNNVKRIYVLDIQGGEIEAVIIAMNCQVFE